MPNDLRSVRHNHARRQHLTDRSKELDARPAHPVLDWGGIGVKVKNSLAQVQTVLTKARVDFQAAVTSVRGSVMAMAEAFRGSILQLSAVEQQKYEISKNPLLAWRVYRVCRQVGLPPPNWVFEYLDRVAANLGQLEEKTFSKPAAKVAEALEMKAPGKTGRGNMFSVEGDLAWTKLAVPVYHYLQQGGQETFAFLVVAEECGMSESTVRRAWIEAQKHFADCQHVAEAARRSALRPTKSRALQIDHK
jgi:hypothetical protein